MEQLENLPLAKMLGMKYPIIMAPMFLVSNEAMLIAATKSGIAGAIPALNYRSPEQLREGIQRMKQAAKDRSGST